MLAQLAGRLLEDGRGCRPLMIFRFRRCLAGEQASEVFGLAHRKLFFTQLVGELFAPFRRRHRKDGAGMTGRDLALEEHLLGVFGKLEQAQGVGDRRAALRHSARNFGLGEVLALHEAFVAVGFLDRVQIGTLDVLDKGELEGLIVLDVLHAHGHLLQAREFAGLPTALAGNDLIGAAVHLAHKDGLQQAFLLDRFGKLGELFFVEARTRLIGIGRHEIDVDQIGLLCFT